MRRYRILSIVLAVVMMFGMVSIAENSDTSDQQAENAGTDVLDMSAADIALKLRPESEEPTHVTVGNSTPVGGSFFTAQFGNNTGDIDVRAMIHGYNPIVWDTQLTFITDDTVVNNFHSETDKQGDTVYTIRISDDLTWNDGSAITAADYVFAFLLQASPEFKAIGGAIDIWKHISGFEEYTTGKSMTEIRKQYDVNVFKGIHLIDDYTFSVTVQKEYLPYFYELAYLSIEPCPISVIVPGCEVADDGKGAYIRNIDEKVTELIFTEELIAETILDPKTGYKSHPMLTCGPYDLVSYDSETQIVEFHVNEYYKGNHDGVKPVITDVTLVTVNPQEMVQKLQDGEVDLINKAVDGSVIRNLMQLSGGVLPEAYVIPEGKDESEIEVRALSRSNYARMGYGFLGLACDQGPQQFIKVRKALASAFDSEAYVRDFLMGFGLTVNGYYGLGQWMTQAAIGNIRPTELTPEEEEIWDSFSLDFLDDYAYDMSRAYSLIIEDGWTLNKDGEKFDPQIDELRYKQLEDGTLMPLSFRFGLTQGNDAAKAAVELLQESIASLNGELIVEEAPYNEVLTDYAGSDSERKYDICFMATNFVAIFDPLSSVDGDKLSSGSQNMSAIYNEELLNLATQLHECQPLDVRTFEEIWLLYQGCYNDLLPTIPIYSNVYFDFYTDRLNNYAPGSSSGWPSALLYAWVGEPLAEDTGEASSEEMEISEEEFEDENSDDETLIID